MPIIWRDDDVLLKPREFGKLLAVDDVLRRHAKVHTIAVIAETLTRELGAAIRERGMSAQLHCWSHEDLSEDADAIAMLPRAVAKMEDMIGVRPTVLYPPWNRTSPALEGAASKLGLAVSWRKISLEAYIRCGGQCEEDTVNFHFWHASDVALLEEALRL